MDNCFSDFDFFRFPISINNKGLFTWGVGGPQVGEVTRLGGIKKNNSPLHAIFLKITEWLLSM